MHKRCWEKAHTNSDCISVILNSPWHTHTQYCTITTTTCQLLLLLLLLQLLLLQLLLLLLQRYDQIGRQHLSDTEQSLTHTHTHTVLYNNYYNLSTTTTTTTTTLEALWMHKLCWEKAHTNSDCSNDQQHSQPRLTGLHAWLTLRLMSTDWQLFVHSHSQLATVYPACSVICINGNWNRNGNYLFPFREIGLRSLSLIHIWRCRRRG